MMLCARSYPLRWVSTIVLTTHNKLNNIDWMMSSLSFTVTLLQKQPEIQYVALRNINLIIQKRPKVLQYEMKVFFCKYNDPIYVKMEKLEIMIMLVSERTIEQVPSPKL